MLDYALKKSLVNGLVIGFFRDGKSYIRVAGSGVTADSCFEIGSITKLFTIELVMAMIRRGVMKWDDSVLRYLPEEMKQVSSLVPLERQVTLGDLASHRSGLPIHPPKMNFSDGYNPFGHYSRQDLEKYLHQTPLAKPMDSSHVYSNLGFAVLGYALENAGGMSYAKLLKTELLDRQGLHDTYLALIGTPLPEVVQGHAQSGRPVPRWTQDAYASAGALCSTVKDLLRWRMKLEENPVSDEFDAYEQEMDRERYLGWATGHAGRWYYREGLTGGFSSSISFSTTRRCGLVLLSNRRCNSLMKALVTNYSLLVEGLTVEPLKGDYGKSTAQILDPLRALKRRVQFFDETWSRFRGFGRG